MRGAETLSLEPLGPEQVSELVERTTERKNPELANRLYLSTRGNPLLVRETLRQLGSDAGASTESDPELPDAARDIVRRRSQLLLPDARQVLEIACVLGDQFELALLERVAEKPRSALLDALDACQASRLIVPSPVAGRFSFSHTVLRLALYAELPARDRQELHDRTTVALEAQREAGLDVPPMELAHHAYRALPRGSAERAAQAAEAAGDAALAAFSATEAARVYARGLGALSLVDGASADDRCRLLIRLGTAHAARANRGEARKAFEQALALARRAKLPIRLAEAALGLRAAIPAAIAVKETTLEAALRESLELVPAEERKLRAQLLARLADTGRAAESLEIRRELSARAVQAALDTEDVPTLLAVLHARLRAVAGPDHLDERLRAANELRRVASESGALGAIWDAHFERHGIHLQRGDIDSATVELEACHEIAEKLEHPYLRWHVRRFRAQRRIAEGEFDGLAGELAELYEIGRRLEEPLALGLYASQLLELGRLRGGLERMSPELGRFSDDAPWGAVNLRVARALLLVERGELELARADYESLAGRRFEPLARGEQYLLLTASLASVCVALCDRDRAGLLIGMLLPFAKHVVVGSTYVYRGSVSHFVGELEHLLGNHAQAVEYLEAALVTNDRLRMRPQAARTRWALADSLAELETPAARDRALLLRREAQRTAEELGLKPFPERTAE